MTSATANQPFVFDASVHPGGDDVVSDTRREIAEIVREVAAAVRSDRRPAQFCELLADRTIRAMAAEGVVLWQHDSTPNSIRYRAIHRLGRITDRSIEAACVAAHDRLIAEVAEEGSPVVVPPTPGATDPNVPSNPTEVPVALAPIDCGGSLAASDYVLEVFLESGGGIATQRGYLRFVAQMADLAGEYFRADQLRSLRRRQILASHVDDLTERMHEINDLKKLQGMIVDGAADAFGFDRVGLVRMQAARGSRTQAELIAVSHIQAIDQKSPAAEQLRQCAQTPLEADNSHWIDSQSTNNNSAESLVLRAIASGNEQSFRLIGMQVKDSEAISDECRESFVRYTKHSVLALQNVESSSGLFGNYVTRMAPGMRHSIRRRSVITAVVVIGVISAAMFPIRMVVDAPAIVRPSQSQFVTAPRDAVVDSISVRHGEHVVQGRVLITMNDPALEEQISTLAGRRAVLVQQQSRLTEAMVDTSSAQLDRLEQVQSERSLVAEEIDSVDQQMMILKRIERSLIVRADRDGVVDAWQAESRLRSRPVKRGDELIRVISSDTSWLVEARVPQNRIAHIRSMQSAGDPSDSISARVSLDADPGRVMTATLTQIGPTVVTENDPIPATATLLQLDDTSQRLIRDQYDHTDRSGAPARVMFACGSYPLAYVLFQDLIHSVHSGVGLYFGGKPANSGDST